MGKARRVLVFLQASGVIGFEVAMVMQIAGREAVKFPADQHVLSGCAWTSPAKSGRALFTLLSKIGLLRNSERRTDRDGAFDSSWVASRVARVGRIWLVSRAVLGRWRGFLSSRSDAFVTLRLVEWPAAAAAVNLYRGAPSAQFIVGGWKFDACRRVTHLSLGI